jgi:hypothetical protein
MVGTKIYDRLRKRAAQAAKAAGIKLKRGKPFRGDQAPSSPPE